MQAHDMMAVVDGVVVVVGLGVIGKYGAVKNELSLETLIAWAACHYYFASCVRASTMCS
jgi:hypothetical protein